MTGLSALFSVSSHVYPSQQSRSALKVAYWRKMALRLPAPLFLTNDSKFCSFGSRTYPTARNVLRIATGFRRLATRAEAGLSSNDKVSKGSPSGSSDSFQLQPGSAVIVTVAPPFVKTADPMPMLRPNEGIVREGDAGRVVSLRPKGQLAVRFRIGTYLLDRKNVKPLILDQKVSDST